MILHYFLIAIFAWVFTESLFMILSSGERERLPIISTPHKAFWRLFAFSWVLPIFIVFITAVTSHNDYYDDNYCWIDSTSASSVAFLLPVCVLIVLTVVDYIIIVTEIFTKNSGVRISLPFLIFALIVITMLLANSIATSQTTQKEYAFSILIAALGVSCPCSLLFVVCCCSHFGFCVSSTQLI